MSTFPSSIFPQIRHFRDSGQHHQWTIFASTMFRDFRIGQRTTMDRQRCPENPVRLLPALPP
jgi:hypothetical protein